MYTKAISLLVQTMLLYLISMSCEFYGNRCYTIYDLNLDAAVLRFSSERSGIRE